MAWFRNPWVIGILGSIPSGFLVNWITGLLLGRRENREYLQKVLGANREVVYAIRPGISEGQIPSGEVLRALVNATSRRYGVEASDLYTSSQIAEELVKEVMDSSFISSEKKQEYCARLAALDAGEKKDVGEKVKKKEPTEIARYRQRVISSVSLLLGLMTATTTVMYSLLELIRSKKLDSSKVVDVKRLDLFVPALAAMATVTVTIVAFLTLREFMRRRREEEVRSFTVRQVLHRVDEAARKASVKVKRSDS